MGYVEAGDEAETRSTQLPHTCSSSPSALMSVLSIVSGFRWFRRRDASSRPRSTSASRCRRSRAVRLRGITRSRFDTPYESCGGGARKADRRAWAVTADRFTPASGSASRSTAAGVRRSSPHRRCRRVDHGTPPHPGRDRGPLHGAGAGRSPVRRDNRPRRWVSWMLISRWVSPTSPTRA
jgi:hypothetical protein